MAHDCPPGSAAFSYCMSEMLSKALDFGAPPSVRISFALGLALSLAILASLAAPASASSESRGAQLYQQLSSTGKSCAGLNSADLEAIGEFQMGRMAGSPQAHEAVNRMMAATMGPRGEARMHELMGRRLAGCPGGGLPAGFGQMMGAMGIVGGAPGVIGAPGQGGRGVYGAPGSMMGGYSAEGSRGDDDEGPTAGAMVGMMAVLIAAVALAAFLLRRRRRSPGPLELLQQRLARGELSAEQYQERKQLLEGS